MEKQINFLARDDIVILYNGCRYIPKPEIDENEKIQLRLKDKTICSFMKEETFEEIESKAIEDYYKNYINGLVKKIKNECNQYVKKKSNSKTRLQAYIEESILQILGWDELSDENPEIKEYIQTLQGNFPIIISKHTKKNGVVDDSILAQRIFPNSHVLILNKKYIYLLDKLKETESPTYFITVGKIKYDLICHDSFEKINKNYLEMIQENIGHIAWKSKKYRGIIDNIVYNYSKEPIISIPFNVSEWKDSNDIAGYIKQSDNSYIIWTRIKEDVAWKVDSSKLPGAKKYLLFKIKGMRIGVKITTDTNNKPILDGPYVIEHNLHNSHPFVFSNGKICIGDNQCSTVKQYLNTGLNAIRGAYKLSGHDSNEGTCVTNLKDINTNYSEWRDSCPKGIETISAPENAY